MLWFNWRDIKNPDAGGAEVFTHEIMRRLVLMGHQLCLFTAEFPNCSKKEELDGVSIIRKGSKYTVYNKARDYYNSDKAGYDIVIDEINTKPFLTPKYVKEIPIVAVFHQLAREFWFYETHFPLNYFGYYYLESKWLSYYKNIPTITVSNSSKKDLTAMGFRNILMVPEGLNVEPLSEVKPKGSRPVIIFIGRLKKAKLPHHALEAFSIIKKEFTDAQMWVIGDGYLRKKLENSENNDIIFYGHVKNELKYELLGKAHLVLVPGVREGWGLIVTESNAMGTPAVAYNVPGLRDSVRNGETGLLVEDNSPNGLANAAISLLKNRDRLDNFSKNALVFSRQFSWNKSAEIFNSIIKDVVQNLL